MEKTFIIRPNRKPLPFKSREIKAWDKETKTGNFIYSTDYGQINAVLKKLPEYGKKIVILEDSTHLLLKETMDTALETGYAKFAIAAKNFYDLMITASELPDDIRVYMFSHVDENINAEEVIKVTGGKMISEKIDPPSLATLALRAKKTNDGYKFVTQSSGRDFYKSPEDMFEDEVIPNDLKLVDDAIKDYYGIED